MHFLPLGDNQMCNSVFVFICMYAYLSFQLFHLHPSPSRGVWRRSLLGFVEIFLWDDFSSMESISIGHKCAPLGSSRNQVWKREGLFVHSLETSHVFLEERMSYILDFSPHTSHFFTLLGEVRENLRDCIRVFELTLLRRF